jgi:acylphosphatase
MKRVHLIISGDVVGVGYRSWMKAAATKLEITGWVKNREDDTVEAMCEGEEENLKTLIGLCKKGPKVAWVEHVIETWQDFEDEFYTFEVLVS